jgi:nicotinamidase-related amidase
MCHRGRGRDHPHDQCDTLVPAGIAPSGVVLSTVRHAADADYGLVVVEGFCAAGGDGDAPNMAAFRNTPA